MTDGSCGDASTAFSRRFLRYLRYMRHLCALSQTTERPDMVDRGWHSITSTSRSISQEPAIRDDHGLAQLIRLVDDRMAVRGSQAQPSDDELAVRFPL